VNRLDREGFWVRGADLNYPAFSQTAANDFVIADLRDASGRLMLLEHTPRGWMQLSGSKGPNEGPPVSGHAWFPHRLVSNNTGSICLR
jgi:hypothetical protein